MYTYNYKTETIFTNYDSQGQSCFYKIGDISFARETFSLEGEKQTLIIFKNGKYLTIKETIDNLIERMKKYM